MKIEEMCVIMFLFLNNQISSPSKLAADNRVFDNVEQEKQ